MNEQARHTAGRVMVIDSVKVVTVDCLRMVAETCAIGTAETPRQRGLTNAANAQRVKACWNACEGLNPEGVPDMVAAMTNTMQYALELMERAQRIDTLLLSALGQKAEVEIGEITRMRGQLSRNRAALEKAGVA